MKRALLVVAGLVATAAAVWRWLWDSSDLGRVSDSYLAGLQAETDGQQSLEDQLGAPVVRRARRESGPPSNGTAYTRPVGSERC